MESKKILIIGNGRCASKLAEKLMNEGIELTVAVSDDGSDLIAFPAIKDNTSAEIFTNTKITGCTGSIGHYSIKFSHNNQIHTIYVSHVIVAEEYLRAPNFSHYGLLPTENVLPLEMSRQLKINPTDGESSSDGNIKIAFLTGLSKESNPVILEEIMDSALDLQSNHHVQTYILTNNLKIAGNGLEKKYRESKETGIIYIKFTENRPEIIQEKDKKVRIIFFDDVLCENFELQPDITIVDDNLLPSPGLKNLSDIFRISIDNNGFLQADNIHRLTGFTNRRGILVTGPSKKIQTQIEHMTDAENGILTIINHYYRDKLKNEITAEINTGSCVHCLTCYRLCPHQAISLETNVTVMQEACEGCGICAAECPAIAIKMEPDTSGIEGQSENINMAFDPASDMLSIVVIACSCSALRAKESAENMEIEISKGIHIISVPCAGGISAEHIFTLFKKMVDGILIMTCHEENCFSETGNIHARIRVNSIKQKLKAIGLNEARLQITSIASNMGTLFAAEVNRFKEEIQKLGSAK